MSILSKLARAHVVAFPETLSIVVTDRAGTVLAETGDVDSETGGAVQAVTAIAMGKVGDLLGLGSLHRTSIAGPTKTWVLVINDDEILGVDVDPRKPLGAFERRLEGILRS